MKALLNVALLTALAKTLDKQARDLRENLLPGEYPVDEKVTLDVHGTVKVFEDHPYKPTTSIPLKVALALFIRYSGATGPNALHALMRAMREALEIETLPTKERKAAIEKIRELANLDEAEALVREGLSELPPQIRKGKVTVSASIVETAP